MAEIPGTVTVEPASPSLPPEVAARQPKGIHPSGQTAETFNARSGRMSIRGMPTKPAGEALAHMRQIAMLEQAMRADMVNDATSEARMRKETAAAERVWLTEVLPRWASHHACTKTRGLFLAGVPASVRPMVWKIAIGNSRGITRAHFERCVQAVESRGEPESGESSPQRTASSDSFGDGAALITAGDLPHRRAVPSMAPNTRLAAAVRKAEAARTQIAVDVPRTHILASPPPAVSRDLTPPPAVVAAGDFRGVGSDSDAAESDPAPTAAECDGQRPFDERALPAETSLREVASPVDDMPVRVTMLLRAFVELQPDMGYVQGMSYLAAMLLFELPSEEAYVAFVNLLAMGHFPLFYAMNHRAMSAYFTVFEQGLQNADKELAQALRVEGAVPQLYVAEWYMTLFSRSLPLPLAQRCWDAYLGERAMLHRVAIAIVVSLKPLLLADMSEALVVLTTLHRHPERVNGPRILQLALNTKSKLPSITWIQQIEAAQTQPWRLKEGLAEAMSA